MVFFSPTLCIIISYRAVLYNNNYYSILYIRKKNNVYRRRRSGYCAAGKYGKGEPRSKDFFYITFNIYNVHYRDKRRNLKEIITST